MERDLPKGWIETSVDEYVINLDNQRKPISSKARENRKGEFPYFGATGQIDTIDDFTHNGEFILIGEDGANLLTRVKPLAFLVKGRIWVNNHAHVLSLDNEIQNKYFTYFFNSLEISKYVSGTAQPKLNQKNLGLIRIKLPPLQEQKRIVAKLDALFASLDKTKARMDKIPELLKNFKQAVLTQAVTGKLTEAWREGKELEVWTETNIGSLFSVKTGSTPKRGNSKYYENGTIPWLKSGQVKNELIYEAEEFITELAIYETNVKIYPKDTLLVAMYGEGKTRGQVGWMKFEATSNQAIAALVNEDMFIETRQYVFYFCLSQYNEIRKQAEGGNQPNLNLTKIKKWKINLPPFLEQAEIVSRVESLFAKADAIEQQYNKLKQKIDTLPQAILAKAFRGELVAQNPLDEPASVLLEKIKVLRQTQGPVKRKTTRKKKVACELPIA